ncbi:MAG: cytochrome c maturation protein CcmE [Chloroflexi bacterium]|nr:cytochrome c maturation protein CcmE [Chloroflexota bacterium]
MSQQVAANPSTEPPVRSKGFFSGSRKLFVAVALLALAIGYFGFTAFQSAKVYIFTVDEFLAGASTVRPGETVRVEGKLVQGSFQRDERSTDARFTLSGDTAVLQAKYDGIFPELFFNEEATITLEGKYDANGVFNAGNVIVKCPSKYQALEEEKGASA